MKRTLVVSVLIIAALAFASCKTENTNTATPTSASNAAQHDEIAAANAVADAKAAAGPGAQEISESSLQSDIQKNPDDTDARFTLGELYIVEGKFQEAIAELKF